jgi:membrane protease YdiL (CAAX protease family)
MQSAPVPAAPASLGANPTAGPRLAVLLLAWGLANFGPHAVVYLATGKIYYQLSLRAGLAAESAIMLLNLLLPVLAWRYLLPREPGLRDSLGWRWTGRRAALIGLLGLALFFAVAIVTQQVFGDPLSTPGRAVRGPLEAILTLFLLLGLTALAEETMFRGWLQTTLTGAYGAWVGIGLTALLFGLRHLPMDLYAGLSQAAPASAWLSRMLQLYLGAIVFGLVRHWAQSTWASWLMHQGILVLIVVLGLLSAS